MKLLLTFLLLLSNDFITYAFFFKHNIHPIQAGLRSLQSSSSYAGPSFGSDSLERPDDEDSPEFKEYLKKLLEMQSLRARTGFSAPSSRSSDAYFAKLNRIKLERAARRELGLPEDVVDFDYRPEDYQSAGTDMERDSDVDLKNSKIFGAKAVSNLARPLTAAEVRLAQAAEERAKRSLEGFDDTPVRPPPSSSSKLEQKKTQQPIPKTEKPAAPKPLSYLEQRAAASARLKPEPPVHQTGPSTHVQASSKPAIVSKPIIEQTPPPPPPVPKVEISSSYKQDLPTQPAKVKNLVLKRKLEVHELDVMGRALEMTVKHRGGGPFGPGRLPESEIPKLEEILNQAYEILVEDSKNAVAVEVENAAKSTEPLPKLNIQTKQSQNQQKPSQVPSHETTKIQIREEQHQEKSAVAPLAERKETAKPAPTSLVTNIREREVKSEAVETSSSQVVPITVGIHRFLNAPEEMHVLELESVRDGLIQILAMVQDHIKRRIRSAPMIDNVAPTNPPPPRQIPVEPAVDATDRFISTYFKVEDDEDSKKFDQELQLALGLLLKHRGGPGFGHGRLKGKELNLLEQSLRSVAQKLQEESQS